MSRDELSTNIEASSAASRHDVRGSTASCSKSRWGRSTRPPTACFAWTWRSTARRSEAQAGLRLSPPQPREDRREHELPRLDAVHRPARLFCSMTNNWAYALSVEKLAGIEVPERAEYIRVILAELTRLQNHASLAGFLAQDMGAWHAADVCLPRARKNSRSVRVAHRLADDVQLHALRRLPRAICRRAGSSGRRRSSTLSRGFSTSSRS